MFYVGAQQRDGKAILLPKSRVNVLVSGSVERRRGGDSQIDHECLQPDRENISYKNTRIHHAWERGLVVAVLSPCTLP